MQSVFTSAIQSFLPSVESFSPYPVWDNKQWSWGYGTAAGYDPNNKPLGSITQAKAMQELFKVVDDHYAYLSKKITRKLTGNQWAALLSFSFNLGQYTADNLVPYINDGNDNALFIEWRKYVHSAGTISQGLVKRREKEIALWQMKDSLLSGTKNILLLIGGVSLLIAGIWYFALRKK